MSNLPVAISVSHILDRVASELSEINLAGGKELTPQGADLQPVKVYMLQLPEHEAALVIDACNMLFAALFEYEDGLWGEANARNATELVKGRLKVGSAQAVVESLFYGPTAALLYIAMDRAPIAYSGLARISPQLNIIDRTYKALKNTT